MTTESNRPPCTRAVSRGSDEEVRAEVGSVPGTPASSTAPPCPARASSSRRVKRRNSAPPREGRVAQHGGARVGAIDDLVPHDGLGELLQRERPDLREREPLTAAEQLDDDAAAQNLPRRRAVAQPPREHHPGADVVRFVGQHFADVQPEPESEPFARHRPARPLRHRHGASHPVGYRCRGLAGGNEI